ncbi:MAG TPA: 3-deoxy-8-phosphooctulonate synthase [Acidobacteriota bacterium]|nr:3-deoxy-8-phosphooctulonate synthase [Acidobacteriota bacterium]
MTQIIRLGDWHLGGGHPFFLISGPCVIESEQHCLNLASSLAEICRTLKIPLIFKASFDKANRTSIDSYRGPGLEKGLEILQKVKDSHQIPVLSDIHEASQAKPAAAVLDILQIPAFLSRQTDLLEAAAKTKRIVNIKKGQFLAPGDIRFAIEKIERHDNHQILVTERGVSFGYHNLVVDFRSFPVMKKFGYPVVFDATHSVQLPGAGSGRSSGQSEFIPVLARAALAAGAEGLFMETHEDPPRALSDGANAVRLDDMRQLLEELLELDQLARQRSRWSSNP